MVEILTFSMGVCCRQMLSCDCTLRHPNIDFISDGDWSYMYVFYAVCLSVLFFVVTLCVKGSRNPRLTKKKQTFDGQNSPRILLNDASNWTLDLKMFVSHLEIRPCSCCNQSNENERVSGRRWCSAVELATSTCCRNKVKLKKEKKNVLAQLLPDKGGKHLSAHCLSLFFQL